MKWPEAFCKHIAEKFYNHYEASGWRLSNGNKVKNWMACFNSQWQFIRYKEDRELLEKLSKTVEIKKTDNMTEIGQLDNLLARYKAKFESVPFDEFGKWYDYLKANRLMKEFTKQDIELIKMSYPDDNYKCRCACVRDTFSGYINTGLTFSHIMDIRKRLQ